MKSRTLTRFSQLPGVNPRHARAARSSARFMIVAILRSLPHYRASALPATEQYRSAEIPPWAQHPIKHRYSASDIAWRWRVVATRALRLLLEWIIESLGRFHLDAHHTCR